MKWAQNRWNELYFVLINRSRIPYDLRDICTFLLDTDNKYNSTKKERLKSEGQARS